MVIILSITFACKRKKDPTPETNTQKLVGKNWKMVAMTVSPSIGGNTDLFTPAPNCEKDNFLNFSANGKFVANEGASKCQPNNPQTETLDWSWTDNETKIVMDGESSDVLQNDGNVLRLRTPTEIEGGNYIVIVTFNKM